MLHRLFIFVFFMPLVASAFEIDFSRRQKTNAEPEGASYLMEGRLPASMLKQKEQIPLGENSFKARGPSESLLERALKVVEPAQDIVILNTENGFVPSEIKIKKGGNYKMHIVNVNENEKNASFVLSAFGQSHAIYFGKVKSFKVEPKIEGYFSFESPETGFSGKLVVYDLKKAPELAGEKYLEQKTVEVSKRAN